MAKRGQSRDFRVKFHYPHVIRHDATGERYLDHSEQIDATQVFDCQEEADTLAQDIAGRGGRADVIYVDPDSKRRTVVTHYDGIEV